jgi:hypothetical protein
VILHEGDRIIFNSPKIVVECIINDVNDFNVETEPLDIAARMIVTKLVKAKTDDGFYGWEVGYVFPLFNMLTQYVRKSTEDMVIVHLDKEEEIL